ncbi:MAG: ABC transporter permease [Nitrospiraceae bacterium]|nr:ABC transporter permease [Nitrospiraceae bacterium]
MRTSSLITWTVWKALFLREAVGRLSAGRAAWAWILLEPVVQVIFLIVLFGFVLQRLVSNIDMGLFVATGVLGFGLARNTAMRIKDAITANDTLLTYRQVLAVDTVLVRAGLEALLFLLSALCLFTGLGLLGYQIFPHDFLQVMSAFVALWLAGIGLGLILSVAAQLIPESGKVGGILLGPLYFVSGIMYPPSVIPPAYQSWFLLNPFVHGIETIRTGFFPQYHPISGVSMGYLLGFVMFTVCLGLALHVRFATRLVAK